MKNWVDTSELTVTMYARETKRISWTRGLHAPCTHTLWGYNLLNCLGIYFLPQILMLHDV